MVLCICRAITEREIDAAVRAGASSVDAVAACCGAGTDCGACRDAIAERISDSCAACPRRGTADCRSSSGALASSAR
jgi:bacterioferritin-associated ferredoxin